MWGLASIATHPPTIQPLPPPSLGTPQQPPSLPRLIPHRHRPQVMRELISELWVSYTAGQDFEGDMLRLTNYAATLATLLETVRDGADGRWAWRAEGCLARPVPSACLSCAPPVPPCAAPHCLTSPRLPPTASAAPNPLTRPHTHPHPTPLGKQQPPPPPPRHCRPLELLRKESLAGLSPSAACRVLAHSYFAVLPITPLPNPQLPLNPALPGPAYFGPTAEAASPWLQLLLYAACRWARRPPALPLPGWPGRVLHALSRAAQAARVPCHACCPAACA
jgi:hypothetical protein